jgi:predicted SpoU family rRNA methylase
MGGRNEKETRMSRIYELIGRLVVGFVRYRYSRELRVAAGVGLAAAVLGAIGIYAATRDDEDEDA